MKVDLRVWRKLRLHDPTPTPRPIDLLVCHSWRFMGFPLLAFLSCIADVEYNTTGCDSFAS